MTSNSVNLSPATTAQHFATSPATSLTAGQHADRPPVESTESPSQYIGKRMRGDLLQKVTEVSYGVSPIVEAAHNKNIEKVHKQVEIFIDDFLEEKPGASTIDIRDNITLNMRKIYEAANVDTSCYRARGSGINEFGKYMLFSESSVPRLGRSVYCHQLFCFANIEQMRFFYRTQMKQKTVFHNHPNPEQDPKQPVLVECASLVLQGTISERFGEIENDKELRKISAEHRDAGSLRAVDNPGKNPPHSIKNIGEGNAITVHAYTMDGISPGQTAAVQDTFIDSKNPQNEVYKNYESFVSRLIAGTQDGREAIPQISARDLHEALREGRVGADSVIVDIREPRQVQKAGSLHIDGARVLYAPRGVAVARILREFPDPGSNRFFLSCRGDARSALLADELRTLGYQAVSVSDGAPGWAAQGLMKEYDQDSHDAVTRNEELELNPSEKLAAHIERLKSEIPAITAQDLAQAVEKEKVVVFDVRQENERAGGVVWNAQRVEAGKLERKAGFHAHELEQPLVIYSGGDGDYRALVAARNLKEMGYTNVRYLEGGYASYQKALAEN